MNKKFKFLLVAMVLGLAMFLSACGGNKSDESKKEGDSKGEKAEITVLLEGHSTSDAIVEMLPEFEKETGIKVNAEVVPYNDLTSKALLNYSNHSGRYDVVMDDTVHGVGYADAGYIVPIDEFIKDESLNKNYDQDDFVPKYLDALYFDKKLYGVPVYGESSFLMYRKDLFDKYGIEVPKTFDEMMEAAKTIHDKTNGEIAGITLRGQQGIHNVYIWAAFLWGFGGQWLEDGKTVLDSQEAAKALDFYSEILQKYGPVGVENFGWQENRQFFEEGKAAMTIDATVNGGFIEDGSSVAGKVGYAPVPTQTDHPKGGNSSLAVHGMYISKDSKNQEAAFQFITWATAKEQQIKSLENHPNSGVSSLAAMESDQFNKKYGTFKDAMLTAIENGNTNYLPQIAESNEIINNTGIAISEALAKTKDAKTALKEANDKNNELLQGK